MCLPKDEKALRQFMMDKKINFNLIKYVDLDNKRLKKTVFKGMRK
jgi:UDP-glucose 6-dehydrogenase